MTFDNTGCSSWALRYFSSVSLLAGKVEATELINISTTSSFRESTGSGPVGTAVVL